jgi:DNA primase/energy-coupling factor transporter ATP-binding protein EcfA2
MEISAIKQQLTIGQVLAHYGLHPDRNQRLRCPFHADSTPSMQVYPKTNTVYCFSGNCPLHGKALDVIDVVMHKEKCSKHEAIERCKVLIEVTVALPAPMPTARETSPTPPPDYAALFRQFIGNFKKSPPAQAYAEKRCLSARLGIGYNGAGWGQLKHCLIFELRDSGGKVVSLYGRSIYDKAGAKHFYLEGRRGLYPWYPHSHKRRLILVESVIDAASLLQIDAIADAYNILALYGTNGLTAEHTQAIGGLQGLEEIILLLNGDEPGRTATAKHATTLHELRPQVTISAVDLPEGEDVNSLLQTHGEEFMALIERLIRDRAFFFSPEKTPEPRPVSRDEETRGHSDSIATATSLPADEQPPASAAASQLPLLDNRHTANGLDTSNPFKLRYPTPVANYYIQGGIGKLLDSLKVTLVVEHPASGQKSRSKLDLYEDRQVARVAEEAAEKLGLRPDLVEGDLSRLTDLLDQYREQQEQAGSGDPRPVLPVLSIPEQQALEAFARRGDLLAAINERLAQAGIVGERSNRLFVFLVALSHGTPEPLHVLIQGSSGSGKTRLLQQISQCMPPESVERFTRLSDKVLYNYPEHYLEGKLLCLEDVDGLSEEAEYAYRELVSNGELISAISIKDEAGRIMSGKKIVRGPVASMACTTNGRVYEDNISRMLLVAVDESREQTERIIRYQNGKAAGRTDAEAETRHKRFLQQFARLLQSATVINPYADGLLLPEGIHKLRRLNDLFGVFIRLVTWVHQYSRQRDGLGRLLSTKEDVQAAVRILFDSIVLKVDELDGSLRQFYERLKSHVKKAAGPTHESYGFTQREVRQAFHLSRSQVGRYMQELVGLEYVQESGFANRGYKYRIVYWDDYQGLRERIKRHLSAQLEAL